MLFAAPGVAMVMHKVGIPPAQAHTRMLAKEVENAWREVTPEPLRYVEGDADLANGVLTYLPSRPELLPSTGPEQAERLAHFGAALVCFRKRNRVYRNIKAHCDSKSS